MDIFDRQDANKIMDKVYFPLMACNLIAMIIFYIIFLIVEIVDIFAEIFKYDKEFLLFFYLRYFFFGFSLIAHVIVIFAIVNYVSIIGKIEGNESISDILFRTFLKVIGTIFFVWTIVLVCSSIPRMIIFVKNKEKFAGFISTMIYLKTFILMPVYINAVLLFFSFRNLKKLEEKVD